MADQQQVDAHTQGFDAAFSEIAARTLNIIDDALSEPNVDDFKTAKLIRYRKRALRRLRMFGIIARSCAADCGVNPAPQSGGGGKPPPDDD